MKSIEEKVNIFLDGPQQETIMHFKSAMIRIEENLYEEAYEKLNSIIDEGITALIFSDRKEISLDAFQEIVNVTKILVIANILFLFRGCSFFTERLHNSGQRKPLNIGRAHKVSNSKFL